MKKEEEEEESRGGMGGMEGEERERARERDKKDEREERDSGEGEMGERTGIGMPSLPLRSFSQSALTIFASELFDWSIGVRRTNRERRRSFDHFIVFFRTTNANIIWDIREYNALFQNLFPFFGTISYYKIKKTPKNPSKNTTNRQELSFAFFQMCLQFMFIFKMCNYRRNQ